MQCTHCGNQLTPEMKVCPQCGTPAQSEVKYCPGCGAPAAADAAFCAQCGAPLNVQAQPNYQQPPYQQGYQPPYPPVKPYQPRSRVTAGLLGIFLGVFGVHNFYLGFTGKAVAQLLISVLSCGTLMLVSGIWGLLEGVQVFTGAIAVDAKNVPIVE